MASTELIYGLPLPSAHAAAVARAAPCAAARRRASRRRLALAPPPREILRERRRHRGLRALLLTSPPRAPARAAARVSLGEGRSEGRAGGRCAAQQKRRPGMRVDLTKVRGFFLQKDRGSSDLDRPRARSNGQEKQATWHAGWPRFGRRFHM